MLAQNTRPPESGVGLDWQHAACAARRSNVCLTVQQCIRQATPEASLAQLAEHALRKRMVAGSIPAGGFCAVLCVPATRRASQITRQMRGELQARARGLRSQPFLWHDPCTNAKTVARHTSAQLQLPLPLPRHLQLLSLTGCPRHAARDRPCGWPATCGPFAGRLMRLFFAA